MKLSEITSTCECGSPLQVTKEEQPKYDIYRCTCGFQGTVIQKALAMFEVVEATKILLDLDLEITVDDIQDVQVATRAKAKFDDAIKALPSVIPSDVPGVSNIELLRTMNIKKYNTRRNNILDSIIKSTKKGAGDDYIICPYSTDVAVFTQLNTDPVKPPNGSNSYYPLPQTKNETIIVPDELTAIALTTLLLQRNINIPNVCVVSADVIPLGAVSLYVHSAFATSCTAGYVINYLNQRKDINIIETPWVELDPYTIIQQMKDVEDPLEWVSLVIASKRPAHALGFMKPTTSLKNELVTLMRDKGYHAKQIDRIRIAGGITNEISFAGSKLFKTMKGYGIVNNTKTMLSNFLCTVKEVIINENNTQELCMDVAVQADKTRHFEITIPTDVVDARSACKLMKVLRTEALLRGHIINPYARTLPADITWLSVFSLFSTPALAKSSDVAGISGSLIRTGTHCYDVATNMITKRKVISKKYTTLGNDAKMVNWDLLYQQNPLLVDIILTIAKSMGDVIAAREDVPIHVVLPMTTMMSSHKNTISQLNYILHERSTVKSEIFISKTHIHKYPEENNGLPTLMELQTTNIDVPFINDNAGSVIVTQQAVKAGLTRNQPNVLYACKEDPIVNEKEKIGRLLALQIAGSLLTVVRAFYKKDMSISEFAKDTLKLKDYKCNLSPTYAAENIDIIPFCLDHLRKLGRKTVNNITKMFNNPKVIGAYSRENDVVLFPVVSTKKALEGNALNISIEQFADELERKYPKKIVEGKYKSALQVPIKLWDLQCGKVSFATLAAKVGS